MRKYGLGEICSLNFIEEVKILMFKFCVPLCLRSRYMAGLVSPSLLPWPRAAVELILYVVWVIFVGSHI